MSIPTAATARNFLQLCQRAAREAGVTNAAVSPLPTTVEAQVGELARMVDYVADAWRELQGTKKWSWMWESVTLTIPAGASSIAAGIPHDRWDKQSVYSVGVTSDSAGRWLSYVPWDEFRSLYPRIATGSTLGSWTIAPDLTFRLNGITSINLPLTAERWVLPTSLRVDGDVPPMPADLSMLLVYMAVRKYAGYDEAGTQRNVSLIEEKRLYNDLLSRCLPEWRLGGSLLDNLY